MHTSPDTCSQTHSRDWVLPLLSRWFVFSQREEAFTSNAAQHRKTPRRDALPELTHVYFISLLGLLLILFHSPPLPLGLIGKEWISCSADPYVWTWQPKRILQFPEETLNNLIRAEEQLEEKKTTPHESTAGWVRNLSEALTSFLLHQANKQKDHQHLSPFLSPLHREIIVAEGERKS